MENTTPKYNPQEYSELADKTYFEYVRSGKYNEIIGAMADLGSYTLRNQMLILSQCPSASKVNTMNGWNYNRRVVQRGEKGIKILAPIFESEGEVQGNKKKLPISGFKINFVFDVSQTQSKNMDNEQIGENGQLASEYYYAISRAIMDCLKGYTFNTSAIEGDAELDTKAKLITLNENLDKHDRLKALVEQAAKAFVYSRNRENFDGLADDVVPNITEIEASGATNIVCKRLGLSCEPALQPDFEKLSDNELNKFASNLGLMRAISQRMILATENAIDEILAVEHAVKENALEHTASEKAQPQMGD